MEKLVNHLSILKESAMFTHLCDSHDTFTHCHDYFEFFYIASGNITHILNGKKQKLATGMLLLLRPDADVHQFVRDSGPCTHRDVVIRSDLFREACDYLAPDAFETVLRRAATGAAFNLSYEQIAYFESVLNELSTSLLGKLPNERAITRLAAAALVSAYYNLCIRSSALPGAEPVWIQELINRFYELENIKLGLPQILRNTHYNRIYVCKAFRAATGTTMTRFLNNIRLNYASLFLKTTDLTVEEIVAELGFSSTTYFYNEFKKKYGCSPRAYKTKEA